ncbi:unnamed protein product [Urochloa humidicola]
MKPRLLKAVATGDLNLLEQALGLKPSPATAEQGDLSCLDGVTAAGGSSALHIAASRGHLELVRTLCAHLPELIRRRNNLGDTPLICAARAGHADVADHLAERALEENEEGNPTLRAANSGGETAMHEAVRNGHVHVLEKLMARDSALAQVVDGNGVSPLYLAVASNQAGMAGVLIREAPDGVKSSASFFCGPDGQTALHAAVYVNRGK